ncbi:MAG: hypothetical protein HKN47_16890 [Pirellulaceae bacterium]|nr:hypothetical protein [Pirellulaceae bacterium]
MSNLGAYKKQELCGAWTRIEMLLQIYDRALISVQSCGAALAKGDAMGYSKHYINAQKAILAIHSGLEPEKNEVAFNVARLLHFVTVSIEKQQFDVATKVLNQLRDGFAAVADEATELEREGKIPAMSNAMSYESTA